MPSPSITDLKYYNAFNQFKQIGAVRFHKIINHFPSLEIAWHASYQEFIQAGIEPNIAEIIQATRPQINPDEEMEKLQKLDVEMVVFGDDNYPALLREIYNPPAVLYVRGNLDCATAPTLAIVGTRKISPYGKQVTPLLTQQLVQAGLTIVSGLALGVDELAHRTVIENNGNTIAVLGCGVDDKSVYPASNRLLAQKIAEGGGAVISELPLGSLPLKLHFPYRNRIISGLSLGTLVIEADATSGSLITAKFALEHNRQVFAVPGSIFNRVCTGPNTLIKQGAKVVTAAEDILEELNLAKLTGELQAQKIIPDSPQEEKILLLLNQEPIHVNKLIKDSGLSSPEVSATLVIMEVKGKVKNVGGLQYVKGK